MVFVSKQRHCNNKLSGSRVMGLLSWKTGGRWSSLEEFSVESRSAMHKLTLNAIHVAMLKGFTWITFALLIQDYFTLFFRFVVYKSVWNAFLKIKSCELFSHSNKVHSSFTRILVKKLWKLFISKLSNFKWHFRKTLWTNVPSSHLLSFFRNTSLKINLWKENFLKSFFVKVQSSSQFQNWYTRSGFLSSSLPIADKYFGCQSLWVWEVIWGKLSAFNDNIKEGQRQLDDKFQLKLASRQLAASGWNFKLAIKRWVLCRGVFD